MKNKQGGFIQLIILIIVVLLIMNYYHFSVSGLLNWLISLIRGVFR